MYLEQALLEAIASLQPTVLQVLNESKNHGGYFEGKESHFKLTVVSSVFEGMRLIQRHQQIYALTTDLLQPQKIHALAIHAYTPEEWRGVSPDSPNCAHQPK